MVQHPAHNGNSLSGSYHSCIYEAFTEHLLYTRHCSRTHGYRGEHYTWKPTGLVKEKIPNLVQECQGQPHGGTGIGMNLEEFVDIVRQSRYVSGVL